MGGVDMPLVNLDRDAVATIRRGIENGAVVGSRPMPAFSPARAVLNFLKDVGDERSHLLDTQRALINMLDDFNSEKERLWETQKALLSIVDDLARILPPNEVEMVTKSQPRPTGAHAREFFTAAVSRSIDGIRLLPNPGSQRRAISRTGETLLDCETRNQLDAKEGDFLIVFGPSNAETVGARVMTVSDGTLLVQLVAGDLEAGTRSVQVNEDATKGQLRVRRHRLEDLYEGRAPEDRALIERTAPRMNRLLQNLRDLTSKWTLEYESAGRSLFY